MNNEMGSFNPEDKALNADLSVLSERVEDLLIERRINAEELIEDGETVLEIIRQTNNNYSLLEEKYLAEVGNDLLSDPEHSSEKKIIIDKKCSIVVPVYNNFSRLQNCLGSIYESTFFKKYPNLLEVIVIDDGSRDEDTGERVGDLDLQGLSIKVFRQTNGRIAKARYSGVLNSTGEVVLFTDPDIVYTATTIEEYMKRHQVLQGAAFFGLRDEIDTEDSRLTRDNMHTGSFDNLPNDIQMDPRVKSGGLEKTDWLKAGGNDEKLPIDEDDERYDWRLKNIAWGFSISADREDLLRTMAGYDERYVGYGGEDEDMIARLIALGNYVIPMTGGFCYHQRHSSGNSDEMKHQTNIGVLKDNLGSSLREQDVDAPMKTDAVLKYVSSS